MENINERDILTNDSIITLRKRSAGISGTEKEEFIIVSYIGSGSSSVCYEAMDRNGNIGRLKEFYPSFGSLRYRMVRRGNHLLAVETDALFGEDTYKDFLRDRDELVDTYDALQKARNDEPALNNYLPNNIEIYFGYDTEEHRDGTVYTWIKNDKNIITFDSYLDKAKKDIDNGEFAEQHLLNILSSILSLSKCIRAMHRRDIFHLDIKPYNFGICVDEQNEIEPSNISLFDLNTIHFFGSELPVKSAGTPGFSAKELSPDNTLTPNERSDIYSIGATLYYSLMYSNGDDICLYSDDKYNDIEKITASSQILGASDINSNSRLFDVLTDILKESLNPDYKKRYEEKACIGLIADLKKAIDILYPAARKQKIDELGVELKVSSEFVDIEKNYDNEIKTGAAGAIQRLLLEKPLYKYKKDKGAMNVLVLGAGTYARKFIDIAFEISQVRDCILNITVISNDCENDRQRYLKVRPAFTKFFAVDDSIGPEKDFYGKITFKSTSTVEEPLRAFSKSNIQCNKRILDDILLQNENIRYSYIFIALGDDSLNRKMADECSENDELLGHEALIAFVQYKDRPRKISRSISDKNNIVPVYVNEVITKSNEYDQLRRMAFNCHILWNNSLGLDINKARGEFRSAYNFNSSFSNVLSIKYKLHSVGIDLESYTLAELIKAADRFNEIITNTSELDELSMYEHRRWVCNYICSGWDTLDNYSELKYDTKDKKAKRHPCLVRSDSEWTLNKDEWTHQKWDEPKSANNKSLDDLDRMSIRLHQHFLNQAKKINLSAIFDETEKIENLVTIYPDVHNAWTLLFNAISEVLSRKSDHIRLYNFYYRRFINALRLLPSELAADIEKQLNIIGKKIYPVLQSQKYTDYKSNDQVLVRNIPFILTYSTSIRLCIPFGVESAGEINNRVLFGNIDAALHLNPSIITYIIDTDDFKDDTQRFERALQYSSNTIEERKMQARIDLIFIKSKSSLVDNSYFSSLKEKYKRIGNIESMTYNDDRDLSVKLYEFFDNNITSRRAFSAIERNSTGMSKMLRGFGIYMKFPSYSLDGEDSNKFTTYGDCGYFNYVRFKEYLRIDEMFASQKINVEPQLPEIPDYMDFWQEYKTEDINDTKSKKEQAWKLLCSVLKKQSETDDCLGRIPISKKADAESSKRCIRLPAFCYNSIKMLIYKLRQIDPLIVGDNSKVGYLTSQSCELTIYANNATYTALENIFSDPYKLVVADKLRVEKRLYNGKLYAEVLFNNLNVVCLEDSKIIAEFAEQSAKAFDILERLYASGKIACYRHDENTHTVQFCYTSPQVKEVMTNEGRILELYVYYKVLEENYFDDVVCGYKVSDEDGISNEFDLILTKGFRSMIIECKARPVLDQSFYHKLSQLNQQYGVNSTAVLIADTLEKPWWNNTQLNDNQRARGNKYNITTVYKHDDILNIGKTLREIMERREI